MKTFLNELKENDYVLNISNTKAAVVFSGFMMVVNLLFYFVLTPQWVSGKSQFGPSPQMVPNMLTIAMFICATIIFVTELRNLLKQKKLANTAKKKDAVDKSTEETGDDDYFEQILKASKVDIVTIDLRGVFYIFGAVLACIFYVLCSQYLGFMITIAIIMVCLMLLYGVRNPITIIIATTVMSVGVFYAFTKLLRLVLPLGTLF